MPRYGHVEEEWDHGRYSLWRNSLNKALQGKRGQQALREMKDALEAMPRKELAAALYVYEGQACAIGALHVYRTQLQNMCDWDTAARLLQNELGIDDEPDPEDDDTESVELGQALGMAWSMAWKIVYENDEHANDPAARWQYMHRWVEDRLTGIPSD